MGNLREIGSHPRYIDHSKIVKLDPESPTFERDTYAQLFPGEEVSGEDMLDAVADEPPATLTPSQEGLIQRIRTERNQRKVRVGLSTCYNCEFKVDRRSFWKRWFQPTQIQADDLRCSFLLRAESVNPVTGQPGYLPEGTKVPSHTTKEPFSPCWSMNPEGMCRFFKPKLV